MERFYEAFPKFLQKAGVGLMNNTATLEEITQGYAGKWDLQTDRGLIPMSGEAAKQFFGFFGLTTAMMGKFSQWPDLQRNMVLARLSAAPNADQRLIARGVENYKGQGPLYQTFMDAESIPVLNTQVLNAMREVLPETALVHKGHVSGRNLSIRIVDDNWYHDLGPGGRALTGMVIDNDEYGGGLQIRTGITKVSCWNYTLDHQPVFEHAKGFLATQTLVEEFTAAMTRLQDTAAAVATRLNEFHDVTIDDVQGMLRLMSGEIGLPQYVTTASEEWWQDAGSIPTLFYVVQALSFGVQKMTDNRKSPQWNRRTAAETQAFHMGDEYAETGTIHLHECPRCHRPMAEYDGETIDGEYVVE
jgi:hypothetical protein